MKHEVIGLMIVVALLGAACRSSLSTSPVNPCAELSNGDVTQLTGREVVLVTPKTLGNGLTQCSYYAVDLELLLTTLHGSDSVSQFVSNTRNIFPTGAQPSIDDRLDVGAQAALITYQSGTRALYVAASSSGGILLSTDDTNVTREMLIQLAKKIAK
jgi:hypothetical protein